MRGEVTDSVRMTEANGFLCNGFLCNGFLCNGFLCNEICVLR